MIVVTGATGHIGNVLVRRLVEEGKDVRALVPPFEDASPIEGLPVEVRQGDVRDLDSLVEAFQGADVVYHLAGMISIMPGEDPRLYQVNVLGTKNVVEACMRTGVRRLVYVSSIHALKEPPKGTVVDESCPFDPDSVLGYYARTKALATLEVLKGVESGLDAVVVCPTGVVGPYDYRISEVGAMILRFLKRKLAAYVEGAYDFVDVRDVAEGLLLASEYGQRGETYILSGEQITVREMLEVLEKASGVRAPSLKIPKSISRTVGKLAQIYHRLTRTTPIFTSYSIEVLDSNSLVSHEKASRELGFAPRPVRESIADAVGWFRKHARMFRLGPETT
jgi:dihydroflavonol-4-reductase